MMVFHEEIVAFSLTPFTSSSFHTLKTQGIGTTVGPQMQTASNTAFRCVLTTAQPNSWQVTLEF
jgi:hypothetical protein